MENSVTERSGGHQKVLNGSKVRKVAKTGAERVREYRARIKAMQKVETAKSTTNIGGVAVHTSFHENLGDNHINIQEKRRSVFREVLTRQCRQDDQEAGDNDRQFVVQVDVHEQGSSMVSETLATNTMQTQSSTEKVTPLSYRSKTAKTPAERARAYRQRKKAAKNAIYQHFMNAQIQSHVDDLVALGGVSQDVINMKTSTARNQQREAREQPWKDVLAPPSTAGSSNSAVHDKNSGISHETSNLRSISQNPTTNTISIATSLITDDRANGIEAVDACVSYNGYRQHDKAHREFEIKLIDNSFTCIYSACDRFRFEDNLKSPCSEHEDILIENVSDKSMDALLMCDACIASLETKKSLQCKLTLISNCPRCLYICHH